MSKFNFIIARREDDKLIPYVDPHAYYGPGGREGSPVVNYATPAIAKRMAAAAAANYPNYVWRIYPLHTILKDVKEEELIKETPVEIKTVKKNFKESGKWHIFAGKITLYTIRDAQ